VCLCVCVYDFFAHWCMFVQLCACAWEREGETARERKTGVERGWKGEERKRKTEIEGSGFSTERLTRT